MRSQLLWIAVPFAACASLTLHACGDGGSSGNLPSSPYYDASPSFDSAARADAPGPIVPPPEVEERRSFQTPQAGGRFVYVANPTRDTVAVIDSRSLAIESIEAGDGPTYLTTVPGQDIALVINVNSHTVTVLRTAGTGTVASAVPIVTGANAIAIAPDGRHAIAYYDSDAPNAAPGNGSFQDVSVITLEAGMDRAVQLSVGFRPIEVLFSADGMGAFVVTEDGISILRFASITGPTIIPNITLEDTVVPMRDGGSDVTPDASADGTVDGSSVRPPSAPPRDVSVTPDGRYAIARVEGTPTLRLVDMVSRSITTLDAGSSVTDLDIAPSGAYALAILRERSEVLRIPIPMGFTDARLIQRIAVTGEFVGSVSFSPDGRRALLYTTALPLERVTLMDLMDTSAPLYNVRLRKPVRAVAFSPDGRSALLVHTHSEGNPEQTGIDLEERIDRSFGYTLLDAETRFAKLQLTSTEVGPFAIVPDGSTAFVLLRNDMAGVAQSHRISMRSFVIDTLTLGSPPNSVGAVPGTQRAFIGQEHPEGRITFIDWTTGALQSVTGFELNSRVVD